MSKFKIISLYHKNDTDEEENFVFWNFEDLFNNRQDVPLAIGNVMEYKRVLLEFLSCNKEISLVEIVPDIIIKKAEDFIDDYAIRLTIQNNSWGGSFTKPIYMRPDKENQYKALYCFALNNLTEITVLVPPKNGLKLFLYTENNEIK